MKEQELSFRLAGIEILQSEIVELTTKLDNSIEFHFDISIEVKLNKEEETVFVAPLVKIRINEMPEYVGKLKIALAFNIKSIQKHLNKNSKGTLPKDIQDLLNSISISTLRGVMFNHFKGTYLHNAILPIVDPKSFSVD